MTKNSESPVRSGHTPTATIAQIAQMLRMDSRDAKNKFAIADIQPVGEKWGTQLYEVRDVVPYLVAPVFEIDEFIQKMSIADLPTMLRKEFWAGMRSRQLFEKEQAELWPTSAVVEMVSTLFKTLRMSLLLSREAVERETELTDRQRSIIQRIIDNALEEVHGATISKFAEASSRQAEHQDHEAAGQEDL